MFISKTNNYIVDDNHKIKIVPISNNLDNIDYVRTIVRRVLKKEEYKGKFLSIKGYLINEDQEEIIIGSKIDNITCPFRGLSRKI